MLRVTGCFANGFANDAWRLLEVVSAAGPGAEVVVEATYGWYWAVDLLRDAGFRVHLAHRSGNDWGIGGSRTTNATPETWPTCCAWVGWRRRGSHHPRVRRARELVRYRAKLVQLRGGLQGAG